MDDKDFTSAIGEGCSIGGTMTRAVQAGDPQPWPGYPANASGFVLTFVARKSESDTAPIEVVGSISNGGTWVVAIPGSATSAFTKTQDMEYAVWLQQGGGDPMLCARGRWLVQDAPGPP